MKTNDEIGASVEPLRKQAAAPQEEAIAEIVSASHDQAEFGERAINFLRDFQHLEYGTKLYPAPQAVQAAVPEAIEQMAVDRYKVVPSHESMFHRWAVVAGSGTQQLYIGREGECQNMARKFMGAFLDGAFVAMQNAAPAHPAEGVPAQSYVADFFREKGFYPSLAQAFAAGVAHAAAMPAQSVDEIMELADEYAGAQACAVTATSTADADTTKERNALLSAIRAALAATQPAAPQAPAAPVGISVPPLTPDEARWAAQSARLMNGPSDTTQPSEYAMAGALALAAKLATAQAAKQGEK